MSVWLDVGGTWYLVLETEDCIGIVALAVSTIVQSWLKNWVARPPYILLKILGGLNTLTITLKLK